MSDDVFKKCFQGCGQGDIYTLDQAADAFQSCIEKNGCSNSACGTKEFGKFKDACQHLQPTPGPTPPTPTPSDTDKIMMYCRLNCDNIPQFKQCVYDHFAEYQNLNKAFQDAEDMIIKQNCKQPNPQLNSLLPSGKKADTIGYILMGILLFFFAIFLFAFFFMRR
jgi:hypothetical protein